MDYGFQIERLKQDFDNILILKKEVTKVKTIVDKKLSELKAQYQELVKANSKKLFLFCLDSFYFQFKIFAIELEHIDRFRSLMNNRLYCDYYKLYNIIIQFIKDNAQDLKIDISELRTYPVYKDVEPYHEYNLEDIKEIHSGILLLINKMSSQLTKKVDTVDHYNENHKIGFSISNFLNTLEYENRLLKEQISLYINYLSFFHISEKRHLNRLFVRMQDFYREIEDNININRTFSIEDVLEQDRLFPYFTIGEDTDDDLEVVPLQNTIINDLSLNRLHISEKPVVKDLSQNSLSSSTTMIELKPVSQSDNDNNDNNSNNDE
jgi:hypothetical protein